ncbi:MAG TPA: glutamine synthetase beta-grasp domain-containing protein, partial [Sphingomonadales bacterium]
MSTVDDVLKQFRDKEIAYLDLRFTDPRGKWQHLSLDASVVNEDLFEEGILFDGSSIAGWKAINESDMLLRPDASSFTIDPFMAQPTAVVICDVVEPSTGEGYGRDPRT